jgi:transcriptional regulator with GAF, ATPase, and Fis domain
MHTFRLETMGWLLAVSALMESNNDRRFDPNFAINLLLDLAHEQSVDRLLQKFIRSVMAQNQLDQLNLACFQIWLVDKGDLCSVCPQRPKCADQTRCLHLVAGEGKSIVNSGPGVTRFDDPNARMPFGVGLVGKVAATGQQFSLNGLNERPEELAVLNWEQEQIHAFSGAPITSKGEVLGVSATFTHRDIPDGARPWGQIFADHFGAAIANARAFEEIQRLKSQLEQQNAYLKEEVVEAKAFGDLVGQSAALRQIVSQIDLVAPTDASVIILGQTGTGKELVAHEIHRRSQRKDKSLVRVNCASIPKDLFESEFFGHARGAFTGAIKDRVGRFETAEGGTLFLDEIGEVPLELQGKLLRVLQEKNYERVGEDRTRHADVRIIAATNRDLKKEVAAGRFREDLYYRLHVFPIHVTDLKERIDDIPLLAKHFVEQSARELKCPKPRLTRAGVIQLQNYDWPGNIRELRNVIERAVILARGGVLEFDLPAGKAPAPVLPAKPGDDSSAKSKFFTETEMEQRERGNLLAVLEEAGWKIRGADGAAEMLGVKPTTLLSRMRKMGLKRPV